MEQLVVVFTNQITHLQRGPKIESVLHWRIMTRSPVALVFSQQFRELSRLHTGEIGRHSIPWQTAPEMRLHPLGPRKMFAIDDVQNLQVDAG